MILNALLRQIKNQPQTVAFDDVMTTISENYRYTPVPFANGEVVNEAGTNEGSCKIFAFAQLNQLDQEQTLACFGRYYRNDVLGNPQGEDHGNIRNFIRHGWKGIEFKGIALEKM